MMKLKLEYSQRETLVPGIVAEDYFCPETALVLPYFHQRFITPDLRFVICEGDFDGQKDVVRLDLESKEAIRMTFDGAAVHIGDLAPDGRHFFFRHENEVRSLDVYSGDVATFAPIPVGDDYEAMNYVHFNADGTQIAMGANRTHASGVKMGRFWLLDVATRKAHALVDRPFQLGHIQCSPSDPDLFMYCHETGGAAPQRMWLVRRGCPSAPLYDQPGHPWVTHETFCRNGEWVVFIRNPEGMARIRPDNSGLEIVERPKAWHPGPNRDASLVVYDSHGNELGLYDWDTGVDTVLLRGEFKGGGPHLHPCFAPDDRSVFWTSSHFEHSHVCRACVKREC